MTTPQMLKLADAIERLEAYPADDIGIKLHREGGPQENLTIMLIDAKHRETLVSALRAAPEAADAGENIHGDGHCGCTERCKDRDNCQYDVQPASDAPATSLNGEL